MEKVKMQKQNQMMSSEMKWSHEALADAEEKLKRLNISLVAKEKELSASEERALSVLKREKATAKKNEELKVMM